MSVFGCHYISYSDIVPENSAYCYQALFNLIQLLLDMLAGVLHHFYFMKDTLHRKPRRHPTLPRLSMPSVFKADSLECVLLCSQDLSEQLLWKFRWHLKGVCSGCITHIPVTLKDVGLSPGAIWANENVIFALEEKKGFDQRIWQGILMLLNCCQTYLSRVSFYRLKIGWISAHWKLKTVSKMRK